MPELLSPADLKRVLKRIPEWELDGKSLTRTVEFEDFSESIDFINSLAEVAEEANHHPDINIRYGKVTLFLTSHSAGGITDADIELAQMVDNLVD